MLVPFYERTIASYLQPYYRLANFHHGSGGLRFKKVKLEASHISQIVPTRVIPVAMQPGGTEHQRQSCFAPFR